MEFSSSFSSVNHYFLLLDLKSIQYRIMIHECSKWFTFYRVQNPFNLWEQIHFKVITLIPIFQSNFYVGIFVGQVFRMVPYFLLSLHVIPNPLPSSQFFSENSSCHLKYEICTPLIFFVSFMLSAHFMHLKLYGNCELLQEHVLWPDIFWVKSLQFFSVVFLWGD